MPVLVDAGPLVAFLDSAERHRRWAIKRIEESESARLVWAAVLAEAMYLLGGHAKARDALRGRLANGALDVAFRKHGRKPLALIQPDGPTA